MDSVSEGYLLPMDAVQQLHVEHFDSTLKHLGKGGALPKESCLSLSCLLKFLCLSSNNILVKLILAALACISRSSIMMVINRNIFRSLMLHSCKLWQFKILDSTFLFLLRKPTFTAA